MALDYSFELPSAGVFGGPYGVGTLFAEQEDQEKFELDFADEIDLYRTRFDSA